MKKYFEQLRPLERRMAIGVLVVLFLVLNWVLIWPHFSDWGNLRRSGDAARAKLKLWQTAIAQSAGYESQVKKFASGGDYVAPENQAIDFTRTIVSQGAASGVGIYGYSPSRTIASDPFFVEQVLNINNVTANDEQLVDFLYKLGSGASMIRVRGLELQPDPTKRHLVANIRLVASYQKTATPNNLKPATGKAK